MSTVSRPFPYLSFCSVPFCSPVSVPSLSANSYKDVTKSALMWGTTLYYNDAEILSLAKDADYAIVTSYGWMKDKTNFDEASIKATLDQVSPRQTLNFES